MDHIFAHCDIEEYFQTWRRQVDGEYTIVVCPLLQEIEAVIAKHSHFEKRRQRVKTSMNNTIKNCIICLYN
jgi:hypothetical protein